MNADDFSPMFPQADDANTPMISGRGTKIIADARGAYLAGNLRGLLGHMMPAQQAKFRAAVADQALYYLASMLPDTYAPCLRILRQHLREPMSGFIDLVLQRLAEGGAITHEHSRVVYLDTRAMLITELAVALQSGDAWYLAEAVRGIPVHLDHYDRLNSTTPRAEKSKASAQRWQMQTAWAILQGREVSPIASFIESQSEHLQAYRRGDLTALVDLLDDEMKAHLSEILVEQALRCRAQLMRREWDSAVFDAIADLREQWDYEMPKYSRLHLAAEIRHLGDQLVLPSDEIVLLISACTLIEMAQWSQRLITNTMIQQDAHRFGREMLRGLRWWQIEAVWAAAQGEALPEFAQK